MSRFIFCVFSLWIGLSLTSCSKGGDGIPDTEDNGEVVTDVFAEGVIEMGMYSHDVDLGYFIDKIDFSRDDVREQVEELIENTPSDQNIFTLIEELSERNPFVALSLMMNAVTSTYYVKDDVVFGAARGFGYEYDNFHDRRNDEGKIFIRTLVQTDEIPEEDRALSLTYVPSVDLGIGEHIEHDLYDRRVESRKENVNGYLCEVSTYTLKPGYAPPAADPENPVPTTPTVRKLLVYTSKLFNPTINFTHPFYLPEEGGILRLEVFYENTDEPTFVMSPKEIIPRPVTGDELQIRVKEPVYTINDTSLAWKLFSIFFSGWGALEN